MRAGALAKPLDRALLLLRSWLQGLGKPEWGSKSTQAAMVSHCSTAFGTMRSHPHRARQSPEADVSLHTSGHQGQAGYKPGPVKVPPSNRGTRLPLLWISAFNGTPLLPLGAYATHLRRHPSAGRLSPLTTWPSGGVEAPPNAALCEQMRTLLLVCATC